MKFRVYMFQDAETRLLEQYRTRKLLGRYGATVGVHPTGDTFVVLPPGGMVPVHRNSSRSHVYETDDPTDIIVYEEGGETHSSSCVWLRDALSGRNSLSCEGMHSIANAGDRTVVIEVKGGELPEFAEEDSPAVEIASKAFSHYMHTI